MQALALVGFMAAGKSTLGPPLAQALGLGFVDLDLRIQQRVGRSIPEIFRAEGEAGFRVHEARVLNEVLGQGPAVLACGGGVLDTAGNRGLLQRWGRLVYLKLSLADSIDRMGQGTARPLAQDPELAHRYARRQEHYAQAELVLDALEPTSVLLRQVLECSWS